MILTFPNYIKLISSRCIDLSSSSYSTMEFLCRFLLYSPFIKVLSPFHFTITHSESHVPHCCSLVWFVSGFWYTSIIQPWWLKRSCTYFQWCSFLWRFSPLYSWPGQSIHGVNAFLEKRIIVRQKTMHFIRSKDDCVHSPHQEKLDSNS